MSFAAVLFPVAQLVVRAADQTPQDEDVKAGWTAFVVFLLLIAAVVVLGFSLVKQLRKAQAAETRGLRQRRAGRLGHGRRGRAREPLSQLVPA